MNYPDGSTSNNRESVNQGYRDKNVIELYKFERDTSVNQSIKYTMIEGYPLSMNAMDINYGATDLLRLTVNFTFVRYVTEPYSTGATSTVGTPPAIAPGTSLNLNFLNFHIFCNNAGSDSTFATLRYIYALQIQSNIAHDAAH